jgi:hypothetical protein
MATSSAWSGRIPRTSPRHNPASHEPGENHGPSRNPLTDDIETDIHHPNAHIPAKELETGEITDAEDEDEDVGGSPPTA